MSIFKETVRREAVEKIHRAVMQMLEKKGIRFTSPRAREVFKAHGFRVEGEIVYFTETQVMAAVAKAPERFVLRGREAKYDVEVGNGTPVLCPAYGPVFVMEHEEVRRGTCADFEKFMKLTQNSPVLNMMNPYVLSPCDIQAKDPLMYLQASCLKYGAKPTMGITAGYDAASRAIALVKQVNQREPEDYVMIGLINSLSPLAFDDTMTGALFAYAEAGQPVVIASCGLAGATAPATVLGTMVTSTAEVLAGVTLAQLIHPGLPCVFGNTSTGTDMHYVTPSIGAPETGRILALAKALSEFYGMPCRSGGSLCDAKMTDYEAGTESCMMLYSTLLSGVDYVMHAVGILDSFNSIGYEKFILDEQNVEALSALLAPPELDEELLGLDMILEEPHSSQYLGTEHTVLHMHELYNPEISLHGYYDVWKNQGAQTLVSKAEEALEKRISAYEAPALSAEAEALLAEYLGNR